MTQDEWKSKSDDWRKGYRAGQGDDTIVIKTDSKDFAAGYAYAIEHPVGPVAIPM